MPTMEYDGGLSSSTTNLKPGKYRFKVCGPQAKRSQAGNEMIEFDLELYDPETKQSGRARFERLTFTPNAQWKIEDFLKAAGHAPSSKGARYSLDAKDVDGWVGWAEIGVSDRGYNEVTRYVWTEGEESINGPIDKAAPPKATDDDLPF